MLLYPTPSTLTRQLFGEFCSSRFRVAANMFCIIATQWHTSVMETKHRKRERKQILFAPQQRDDFLPFPNKHTQTKFLLRERENLSPDTRNKRQRNKAYIHNHNLFTRWGSHVSTCACICAFVFVHHPHFHSRARAQKFHAFTFNAHRKISGNAYCRHTRKSSTLITGTRAPVITKFNWNYVHESRAERKTLGWVVAFRLYA